MSMLFRSMTGKVKGVEMVLIYRLIFIAGILSLTTNCGEVAEDLEKAARDGTAMTLSGTVTNTEGAAIEGAEVRFIKLLDQDAINQLVETKEVDDGSGGKKNVVRIKFDQVNDYTADLTTTTDKEGKFEQKAAIQLYLVYILGPGAAPGENGAYVPTFWGINGETGELDLDHLIGKDGKLEQANTGIQLAGGPTPPPAPAPVEPPPPPEPVVEAEPPTTEAEPTVADASRPEEIIRAEPATTFWKSIELAYDGGSIAYGEGKSGTIQVDSAPTPSGQQYLNLTAELVTAQTEVVYLVVQSGFDTSRIKECTSVTNQSKTHVYPVAPNGTTVSYKLVPPAKFYKLFFAKTATKADGTAVTSTDPTETLIVGKRECDYAKPNRPFLATLSWDKEVDLDVHLLKFNREKMTSDKENSTIDSANWQKPTGASVTLDVDNLKAYGPESVGESSAATDVNSSCYKVMVHYYSGSDTSVTAKVDVTHSVTVGPSDDAKTMIEKYSTTKVLTAQNEWWMVGTYPPDCEVATPVASTATASACSNTYSSFFDGLATGESGFKGYGNFGGSTIEFQCKWAAGRRYPTSFSDADAPMYSNFSYSPGNSAGTTTSPRVVCRDSSGNAVGFWAMRAANGTEALSANTGTSDFPYVQVRARTQDFSFNLRSPNVFGTGKGGTFKSGDIKFDSLVLSNGKPTNITGCVKGAWTGADGKSDSDIYGYFKLNY